MATRKWATIQMVLHIRKSKYVFAGLEDLKYEVVWISNKLLTTKAVSNRSENGVMVSVAMPGILSSCM